MCELLGVTSKNKITMDKYFETFFSHSVEHRNGWGLALFDDFQVFIEKEPARAIDSSCLKSRLEKGIQTSKCIAHIRRATIGQVNTNNSHPFAKCDDCGRMWVLAHNGTIFDSDILAPYQYVQEGTTDSERILLYLVDQMNRFRTRHKKLPDEDARIRIVDEMIQNIVPGNKVNLMIYDGSLFYVHKNEAETMYRKEEKDGVIFSTQPLDQEGWEEVVQNRLLVFQDGKLLYVGSSHDHTYVLDEEKMRLLFFDYSSL